MSTESTETTQSTIRSVADDGIVAEVKLDHPNLVLRPTLRRAPDVTVEPEYWTTVDECRTLLFCSVSGGAFEEFESGLEIDPTVRDPVLVDRYPDRRVYRVELTDRAVTFVEKTAEVSGRVVSTSSCRDGWIVQLRLPNRDSLLSFNEFCRDREITFQVNHLRASDVGETELIGLTPKQQELLTVAYEEGYFNVPRGISQHELADRLDVSKSAVSQRLRRAIAELCSTSLS